MRWCIEKITTHSADDGTASRGRRERAASATCLGFVLLALTFLFAGCGGGGGKPADVEIFFTSQTRGKLTHCGCFSGQYGGLARLRTALEARRVPERVGVDVGDALEGTEDFQILKHRQVLKAYAGMGYAALNAGSREASLPAETIRRLGKESPVPFLSANLRDRSSGEGLLKPWTITQRAGKRIAFIGVVSPATLPDEGPGEGVDVEPIETCLSRVIPELQGKADALVLLAYADESTLRGLAARFYELTAILGGAVSQPAQRLVHENRSLVYYTGNESKSYGYLELRFGPGGKIDPGRHAVTLLAEEYPEDPGVLALLAEYRAETRIQKFDIDDPARAMADRVPGVRRAAEFVGSQTCAACHPTAAAAWQRSAHAHAFESLVARGADSDPSCIACHTVGFGTASGYLREYGRAKLTDVGCESCHGPGSRHVAERGAGGPITFQFRPLGPGDCQKCHHGEFSRPFDWDAFWPHIQHGKEPGA